MNDYTQVQKIVDFCDRHIWITQRDAYKLGIYRLASRIYDMDEAGFVIIRETIEVENADGSKSRIKRYAIARKPGEVKTNAENVSV